MNIENLRKIAKAMVAKGKGILAIDESASTCKKRFDALNIDCTEENRRKYRQLLVTAPEVENYVSGMILYDETLRQKTDEGVPFPEVLKKKNIITGIKVDMGPKDLALHEGEKVTEGLDGLRERLQEYKKLGADFSKWRAVISISDTLPSVACLKANAHALARYAALSQEAEIVPIVEPEVLMDGSHSLEKCLEVTGTMQKFLFEELKAQGAHLDGLVLKASMVLPGQDAPKQASVKEVAEATIKCLKENVPSEVPGVVFLSGGQSDQNSTAHLNEMNKIGGFSWPLSFSYGRAIQRPALNIWAANMNDVAKAQEALVGRAKLNSLAALGQYSEEMEK